ncbi:DUF5035 family protein [Bacteroides sp. 224]|uniref:DUF5035 family protein n=1 Tax=Bacteroides sp. 224 TaxID=2302936 RepID=UPI0013D1784F|nr:DUF5035 family protein [Bacteroides sp. 224]NDV65056.1 DUF5035 domain-containing protein [Bacteroides sp. 224]
MKNQLILILFSILLYGCSEAEAETPILELTGVYTNESDTNYANTLDQLPTLSVGDEIDISFYLNGNGNNLRSFVLKNNNSAIKTKFFFYGDDISDDFSDLTNGVVGFVDIPETEIAVKATILEVTEENPVLSFYLSSKAVNCEGASFKLEIPVGEKVVNNE